MNRTSLCVLFISGWLLLPGNAAYGDNSLIPKNEWMSDEQAYLTLARALAQIPGREEETLTVYRNVVGSPSVPQEVHAELAALFARLARFDEAIDIYLRLPPQPAWLVELGDIYVVRSNFIAADDAYRRALKQRSFWPAVQRKLGLVSYWRGNAQIAVQQLQPLYNNNSADMEVAEALIGAYGALDNTTDAESIAAILIKELPTNARAWALHGQAAARAGHATTAQASYARALTLATPEQQPDLRLDYATWQVTWGDFYGAEQELRNHLAINSENRAIQLRLAEVLSGAQRYAAAEGIYRLLLMADAQDPSVLLPYAALMLREKRFRQGLELLDRLPQERARAADVRLSRAELLRNDGRQDEAAKLYQLLLTDQIEPEQQAITLVALGRIAMSQDDSVSAKRYFKEAFALAPHLPKVRYAAGLSLDGKSNAPTWTAWAELLANDGQYDATIAAYQQALEIDPAYFPALIGLAEALAAQQRYTQALKQLARLDQSFPNNFKILLMQARVFSWSRHYAKAYATYDRLHVLNPRDPLPLEEKARVAGWAKNHTLALRTYDTLLEPPVDLRLRQMLLAQHNETFPSSGEEPRLYQDFERYVSDPHHDPHLVATLWETYRVQKAVYLERKAKHTVWLRRFQEARKDYREWISERPNNQEARFDQAQVACILRLCNEEKDAYHRLIALDPRHEEAIEALGYLKQRRKPRLTPYYQYWNERGRDELSDLHRHEEGVKFSWPFGAQQTLHLSRARVSENAYRADQWNIGMEGKLSARLGMDLRLNQKTYRKEEGLGTNHTGQARFEFDLDSGRLGVEWKRADEHANLFALRQDIHADHARLDWMAPLGHFLDLNVGLESIYYSDNNHGQLFDLSLGWRVTEHPRQFKVALDFQSRDTKETNIYQYNNGVLNDIRHPYWTPHNYQGAGITFEWSHDLAKRLYCGAPHHSYDLRLGLNSDSEGNPALRLEGEWQYDFSRHWSFSLNGLIQRSSSWDANSLGAFISYLF